MIKMRMLLLLCLAALCFPVSLTAQSNSLIDMLLEEDEADWEKTVFLVLSAAGIMGEDQEPADALPVLEQQNWMSADKAPGDTISLGELSYLLMQAFEVRGGLMYRLFPGPRYAARELAYLNLLEEDTSPYRTVSGDETLRILGGVMEWKEAQQ